MLLAVKTVKNASVNVTSNSPSQDYIHPDNHKILHTYKKFRSKCTFKDWKLYFSFAKFSAHPERLVTSNLNLQTKMWQCPVSSLGGWQAWFCSVLRYLPSYRRKMMMLCQLRVILQTENKMKKQNCFH